MLQKQLTILKQCRAAVDNIQDAISINQAIQRAKASLAVAFGENSSFLTRINQIDWRYRPVGVISYIDRETGETIMRNRSAEKDRHFAVCCELLASILDSAIEQLEIQTDMIPNVDSESAPTKVTHLFDRFHLIAGQLRTRHSERPTLNIQDEYDVQDLLHSLLWLHFADIRREEYVPSSAGANSRTDFLLKPEKIVIETKIASNTEKFQGSCRLRINGGYNGFQGRI